MSTLAFQPDAERYYSQGYWRTGDLWGEFARSASADPAKIALIVEEQSISYGDAEARGRCAVRASGERAACVAGDVVLLLGRNSIEAAVAPARVFSPRRRGGSAAADVRPGAALRAGGTGDREGADLVWRRGRDREMRGAERTSSGSSSRCVRQDVVRAELRARGRGSRADRR